MSVLRLGEGEQSLLFFFTDVRDEFCAHSSEWPTGLRMDWLVKRALARINVNVISVLTNDVLARGRASYSARDGRLLFRPRVLILRVTRDVTLSWESIFDGLRYSV